MNKKTSKVCVLFASGMEEMEAIILVDVLRRGDVDVTTISGDIQAHSNSGQPINPENLILASRKTWHIADVSLDKYSNEELLNFDMILIPGGLKGADYWNSHPRIKEILELFRMNHRWIGAICAAPKILLNHGILIPGDKFTAYPGSTKESLDCTGANIEILRAKKIITSKGPGTAFCMALEILEILQSKEIRDTVKSNLFLPE